MKKKIRVSLCLLLLILTVSIMGTESKAAQVMQNTPPFHGVNGELDQTIYSTEKMKKLETIAVGDDEFTGNSSFRLISEKNIYGIAEKSYYSNIVGNDGVLKLYNQSEFMGTKRVKAAAEYWNVLAGGEIVKVVDKASDSDQVVYDSPAPIIDGKKSEALGGQTYTKGMRIKLNFYIILI